MAGQIPAGDIHHLRLTVTATDLRAAQGYVAEEGVHPHDVFFLESIKPLAIERMKPLRDRAYEGRVTQKAFRVSTWQRMPRPR